MKYKIILLTIALLFNSKSGLQLSAETIEINKGYYYEINHENKVATLVRYTGASSNVNIPNTIKHNGEEYDVTAIYSRAFSERQIKNKIKKIRIGNSVKRIDDNTFEGCISLHSVVIGSSISDIGYSAFYGCKNLASISIPSSVMSIGNYAFADCTALKSIDIGKNVTNIGNKAFKDCLCINTLILPKYVSTIGEEAFAGCEKLNTITCNAEKVPNTEVSAFKYIGLRDKTLRVPELSISEYQNSVPWNNFGTIEALSFR